MSNNKMKGLLKGLRYISQIFDNEKEPEMQIGYPTDVKHVAHIGWDGPSVNSPSWMNEFKAPASFSNSAPLNSKGEPEDQDDTASWASEESTRRISKSSRLDGESSEKPKSRRNSSSGGLGLDETVIKEKLEKPKQRRSSKTGTKDPSSEGKSSRQKDDSSSTPANLPKKSRRKKSKDITSSKASRSKAHAVDGDCGSDCGSVSRSVHNDNSECGSNVSANFSALEDETEHGFNGIC